MTEMLEKLMKEGAAEAFPAGVLGWVHSGRRELIGVGVEESAVFDLASVTKVVATTAAVMLLYERGELGLEQRVVEAVPEFAARDARKNHVTFRMLLAHSSGLPAHEKFYLHCKNHAQLMQAVYATKLEAEPMSRAVYSDIGFIVLGEAIERTAGESLDKFCEREIFAPLGMASTMFNPPAELKPRIVPTADDKWFRHRVIQGEVHDDNAYVMGGVAGHAGLFSNAKDVLKFAECMLRSGEPLFKRETVELFARRESQPAGTTRALGWDTPSQPSQSGKYLSTRAYGHLGYTGTSLWIDLEKDLAVVLLTNRTWPDNKNEAIKKWRPIIHDAVAEELGLAR